MGLPLEIPDRVYLNIGAYFRCNSVAQWSLLRYRTKYKRKLLENPACFAYSVLLPVFHLDICEIFDLL